MSADLFAEFSNSSSASAQPPKQSAPFASSQPSSSQRQTSASSPFDFFQGENASSPQPTVTPQWPASQQQESNLSSWGPPPTAAQPPGSFQQTGRDEGDDDDTWGDFEVAETVPPAAPAPAPAPALAASGPAKSTSSNQPSWQSSISSNPPEPRPRTRIVRASTFDLMTNNLVDLESISTPRHASSRQTSSPEVKPSQRHSTKPVLNSKPKNLDVLFDVDDFELQGGDDGGEGDEDVDDFGDFETSAPTSVSTTGLPPSQTQPSRKSVQSTVPSLDLLSLYDSPQPPPLPKEENREPSQLLGALSFGAASAQYPEAPKSPSFQDRNPFTELSVKTPTAPEREDKQGKSPSPVTAWPPLGKQDGVAASKGDEDEWAAWDDVENNDKKVDIDATKPPESWDWDEEDNGATKAEPVDDNAPPPVNVPPPSVILSAFPDLLQSGNSLLKPVAGQDSSIKQRILANPKAADFLRGYILVATTAARVIAGRKHRWHRDKILAKSMSISAAGSKGMKLAGVDKTQSAREDREAADVVAVWREHVGRLRSAVAATNAAGKTDLRVPELSESMLVQTAKMVPTAPKPCVICGLKREERVAKVDHDVEDSFGEWWMDHWGHRACKNFWVQHEQNLRQR